MSTLKLWKMRRAPSGEVRREALCMVIAAKTEQTARNYAKAHAKDEGTDVWSALPCEHIGNAAHGIETGVICCESQEP